MSETTQAHLLRVTEQHLLTLCPNARTSIIKPMAEQADDILSDHLINANYRRLSHFFAQIAHESGGFRTLTENLNYSAASLRRVWPKHFNTALARQCHRQPEPIANIAYCNRMGNGSRTSGDGFMYRGRGLIQLTGKYNYQRYAEITGLDIVSHPDIAAEPKNALLLAAAYWKANNLNHLADYDQLTKITKKINGGTHGLKRRRKLLIKAIGIWQP